jgi:hypothetical protein
VSRAYGVEYDGFVSQLSEPFGLFGVGVYVFNPNTYINFRLPFNLEQLWDTVSGGGQQGFAGSSTRTIGPIGRVLTIAEMSVTDQRSDAGGDVVGPNEGNIPSATIGARLWVCATESLSNGVWAQIDLVAGLYAPARIYTPTVFGVNFNVNSPGAANDGKGLDYGIPMVFDNDLFRVPFSNPPVIQPRHLGFNARLWRLSYGYTYNSEDFVKGVAWSESPSNFGPITLSVDPYAALGRNNPELQVAGISFAESTVAFSPFNQIGFSVDPRAIATSPNFADRHIILETKYRKTGLGNNEDPPVSERIRPRLRRAATAVISGLSQMPVSSSGSFEGLPYLPVNTTSDQALVRCVQYEGTALEWRPDLTAKASYGVTNGPSWHEQAIVSHGTANAIQDGRRNLLLSRINPPGFSPAAANPEVLTNFELTGAPTFNFITVGPEIDGRPLQPRKYYGRLEMTPLQYDGSSGQYISSAIVECFATTRRWETVLREGEWQFPLLPDRLTALAAGMSQDLYDFYKRGNSEGATRLQRRIVKSDARLPFGFSTTPIGVHEAATRFAQITLRFHYSVKIQVFRWGTFQGDRTRHEYFTGTETITLTHDQCDLIANNGFAVASGWRVEFA